MVQSFDIEKISFEIQTLLKYTLNLWNSHILNQLYHGYEKIGIARDNGEWVSMNLG